MDNTSDSNKKRKLENDNNNNSSNGNGESNDHHTETKDEDEDIEDTEGPRKRLSQRKDCPYLDTVKRHLLDFDFEKLCSVTLQNLNVYACLVCGKYFQGRGRNSQAYLHSLQADHHVFINLHNEKVYCLPDDYEVIDSSLADIKYVLNPTFTEDQIAKLDSNKKTSTSLEGVTYVPGYIGLNNIKSTDYLNAAIQALSHVTMLRNFVMIEKNYSSLTRDPLIYRFGELVRKMYNAKNFKAHVDPHEFVQAVSTASKKRFHIGVQSDPIEFIQFFLNYVHRSMGGSKKTSSSIISQVFQGKVEVITQKVNLEEVEAKTTVGPAVATVTPFFHLTLDIPAAPLFKDEAEKNVIPQITIFQLLEKFNGMKETHFAQTGERKRFLLVKLPQYLIFHIKRFTKNTWFVEKNPTIVTSPLKSLDLKEYVRSDHKGSTKYDLVANICHEGEYGKGIYKAQVLNKAQDQWFEIQDLSVRQILPQMIMLSESYVQIYERQKD